MLKYSSLFFLSLIVLCLTSCQQSDSSKPADANTPANQTANELNTPQCRTIEKSKTSKTSLHYAVLKKDFTSLVSLINANKIDINSVDEDGLTAFDYAINLELEDHAQVLLENGARINGLDNQRSFPLQIAVIKKSEKMIKFLIEKKAYINQRDSDGVTALMSTYFISSQREFSGIFSLLLDAGAKAYLVDCKGENFIFNNLSLLDLQSKSKILNQFIDLNKKEFLEIKGMPGILVLMALDISSDIQLALNLIKMGAKANAPGTLSLLLKNYKYRFENIEDFIAAGADVNSKLNKNDMSALEFAINYYGINNQIVSILLKNGAQVDATSKNIRLNGSEKVQTVQKLKDLGFTVSNFRNYDGEDPLILAASRDQNIPLMNFLLDNGADPKVVDYSGRNSLYFLFSTSKSKNITFDETKNIVAKMIKLGLNVALDTKFYRVLTEDKYIDILKMVAENGAELNIIDNTFYENPLLHGIFRNYSPNLKLQNWTTGQLASLDEIQDLLSLFASRGYDFNKQNRYGETLETYIEKFYKNDPESKNKILQHLKSLKSVKPNS